MTKKWIEQLAERPLIDGVLMVFGAAINPRNKINCLCGYCLWCVDDL